MGGPGSGRRSNGFNRGLFNNYKSRRSIALKATGRKKLSRSNARLLAGITRKNNFKTY